MNKDLASFLELDDQQLKIVKGASTSSEVGPVAEVDPTAGSTAVTRDTKEGDNDSGSSALEIGIVF